MLTKQTNQEPTAASPQHARASLVRQAELVISQVLRGGVLLSAAIIAVGVLDLYRAYLVEPQRFQPGIFPHSLSGVISGLAHGDPQAIIVLGLLVLLATPMVRVVVSVVAFALEGDHRYTAITTVVLLILCASFFLSRFLPPEQVSTSTSNPQVGFFLVVFIASLAAGLVGSLVGLGGGVFVVPLLTLLFHLPIQEAIGASIVSVIATSSGAAAAYVRDRMTNLRVGMLLEIATTIGAISGAFLAVIAPISALFLIFGVVLLVSAVSLVVKIGEELPQGVRDDRWSRLLSLASSYPDEYLGRAVAYEVTHVPQGFSLMYIAGLISGLLGIGSGTFKVLAMDTAMRLPLKVSTTTSNFMIGVTAAASAGIYFARGDIDPLVAAPVALGVLVGAVVGAMVLPHLSNATIRKIFVPLVVIIAAEMLIRGGSQLLAR